MHSVDELLKKHQKSLLIRDESANKGSYGKLLIIAGSRGMAGAAYLSGLAAYKTGMGMVRYFGPESNRSILQTLLPEAMYDSFADSYGTAYAAHRDEAMTGYIGRSNEPDSEDTVIEKVQSACGSDDLPASESSERSESHIEKSIEKKLEKSLDWADSVVIGPGLSKGNEARAIVRAFFKDELIEKLVKMQAVIIDADALNIIAEEGLDLRRLTKRGVIAIVTPHMMEMLRLIDGICTASEASESGRSGDCQANACENSCSCSYENSCEDSYEAAFQYLKKIRSITDIKADQLSAAKAFNEYTGTITVLKDAVTAVAAGCGCISIDAGCGAMAKAGSGDVLSGVIAGTIAILKGNAADAVPIAVYLHGRAGTIAAEKSGTHSLLARDIAEAIGSAMRISC